ncbi:MAG: hypothetical protein CVU55_12975 [Deltaproteobacteria bacterium HGW-Deltaproteobacteria-13]|nr:MAG: hypothetical protein CVU55_12975 [Deltaproteobacteria bacterium HGW-Deltaproteobacteria-13]
MSKYFFGSVKNLHNVKDLCLENKNLNENSPSGDDRIVFNVTKIKNVFVAMVQIIIGLNKKTYYDIF